MFLGETFSVNVERNVSNHAALHKKKIKYFQ